MDGLFQAHRLNEDGLNKADRIANAFTALLDELKTVCPDGTREFSITKTKLEEACFYAKKSMASERSNQNWS